MNIIAAAYNAANNECPSIRPAVAPNEALPAIAPATNEP